MSRLKALKGKSSIIMIGDLPIVIKSLTFTQLSALTDLDKDDSKDQIKFVNDVLFYTLRNSFPTRLVDKENGFTDDEIRQEMEEIDIEHITKIVNETLKISGMVNPEKK